MAREPLYDIRQKIRAANDGNEYAIVQALNELESLFSAAKFENRLDPFLRNDALTAIDAISCERSALTIALLRWLPDDDFSELALALCHSVDVHHLQVKVAVAFELTGSDARRADAVALRHAGNNATPAVSIGWLLSMAAAHGNDERTMALVTELMLYHVEELPRSTEQLLSNEQNPLVCLDVSRNALDQLRKFKEHLKELPEVRELVMPVHMRLMYSSIRRKRSRAINADSEKRSFFASLFQTRRFKYSTRAAVEIHHGDRTDEQTLTMAPFSVSVELPLSEITDPMAAHFQRQDFKRRGKI